MKVKVCLIQDSPVFFDKKKSIDKVEELTKKYAKQGENYRRSIKFEHAIRKFAREFFDTFVIKFVQFENFIYKSIQQVKISRK